MSEASLDSIKKVTQGGTVTRHHQATTKLIRKGAEMEAIYIYQHPCEFPKLSVQQHVVIRAVKSLPKLEALALIRGSFTTNDGGFANLDDALEIYNSIIHNK